MFFNKRSAGILCPIFSLPNAEGIGTLGNCAYDFVDFLVETNQTYWQVLPIGTTSYGNSPYQSFSSFAGNPFFIDLDLLKKEGLLHQGDLDANWDPEHNINYAHVEYHKYEILKKAFKNSAFTKAQEKKAYLQFPWLEDFGIFMSLRATHKDQARVEWGECSTKELLPNEASSYLNEEGRFHIFLQVKFYEQWFELKKYANARNISLVGDLPIFVSGDSVDVWVNPEFFLLDEQGISTAVAGVPPDYFSDTGQLWGNPLYDWDKIKEDDFTWWIDRITRSLDLFDVLRIDHFRGFESYWSIPQGEETAINGEWVTAPGQELFDLLKEKMGELPVIAEDLGIITEDVKDLMLHTGFPGMSVLQFAFDHHSDNPYKPENTIENKVVYTGTHDNDTTKGWYLDPQNAQNIHNAIEYFPLRETESEMTPELFVSEIIEIAWSTKAIIAVLPIQDLLSLGGEARMNTPSTVGDHNWSWRMKALPDPSKKQWLKDITLKHHRA